MYGHMYFVSDTCRLYPESKIDFFLLVSRSWTCSTLDTRRKFCMSPSTRRKLYM